jgi:uncharacterized protein YkwD
MKTTKSLLFIISLCFFAAACGKNNKSGHSSSGSNLNLVESEATPNTSKDVVLQQLNKLRQAAGAPRLAYDGTLEAYAQGNADDLSDGRVELGNVGTGRRCSIRFSRTGQRSACAEFVLRGRFSAETVVQEWMKSESNSRSLKSPELRRVGIGASMDRQGRVVWVLLMISSTL